MNPRKFIYIYFSVFSIFTFRRYIRDRQFVDVLSLVHISIYVFQYVRLLCVIIIRFVHTCSAVCRRPNANFVRLSFIRAYLVLTFLQLKTVCASLVVRVAKHTFPRSKEFTCFLFRGVNQSRTRKTRCSF